MKKNMFYMMLTLGSLCSFSYTREQAMTTDLLPLPQDVVKLIIIDITSYSTLENIVNHIKKVRLINKELRAGVDKAEFILYVVEQCTQTFHVSPKAIVIRLLRKMKVSEEQKQALLQHYNIYYFLDKTLYEDLVKAIRKDNKAQVKALLQKNTDANMQDGNGETALMLAVAQTNKDIIYLLLDAGADVNIKNKYGQTALMLASIYFYGDIKHRKDILQLLIQAGADVNAQDISGNTALKYACSNHDIAELLKQAGTRT